jgi:Ca2+-binding EF-hand superfamily protein
LHQFDRDDVRELIAFAFQEADVEGRGALDRDQVYDILSDLGANSLDLKPGEINALVSAVDENEDGEVTYAELTDFLCNVLEHLSRERWIQEVAFGEHGFEEGDDGEEYADDDGSYESA